MSEEITTEQIQELMKFLTNEGLPEGMVLAHRPKLKTKTAFSVVWFLQEHLMVLPSKFDMCDSCNEIYDSYCEGYCLDNQYMLDGKVLPKKYWGHYCNSCVPDVDFELA